MPLRNLDVADANLVGFVQIVRKLRQSIRARKYVLLHLARANELFLAQPSRIACSVHFVSTVQRTATVLKQISDGKAGAKAYPSSRSGGVSGRFGH